MPGLASSLLYVCWLSAPQCTPNLQDRGGKSLPAGRGFGGDRQAFQFHVEALHAGLVKLDNDVGWFKARGFNVQSMFANGNLKRAKFVGGSGVNSVERDASVWRIGVKDQRSHTVPFVAGVGVAARLARIFTGRSEEHT